MLVAVFLLLVGVAIAEAFATGICAAVRCALWLAGVLDRANSAALDAAAVGVGVVGLVNGNADFVTAPPLPFWTAVVNGVALPNAFIPPVAGVVVVVIPLKEPKPAADKS